MATVSLPRHYAMGPFHLDIWRASQLYHLLLTLPTPLGLQRPFTWFESLCNRNSFNTPCLSYILSSPNGNCFILFFGIIVSRFLKHLFCHFLNSIFFFPSLILLSNWSGFIVYRCYSYYITFCSTYERCRTTLAQQVKRNMNSLSHEFLLSPVPYTFLLAYRDLIIENMGEMHQAQSSERSQG